MSEDRSDEREFLHDLASPIAAAIFLVDSILGEMQTRSGIKADDLLRISQLFESLEVIKKKLEERREILIKRRIPSARS